MMTSKGNNFAYMPNTSDVDPDMLLNCPYDLAHRILAKRFPYHVMKCRKNHILANMSICPFNARHIIPISELRHHVANCLDRSTIEPDIAYAQAPDGSYMKGDTSVPSYHHEYHPPSTENWDAEVSNSSRIHVEEENPNIIHNLVGMTRSQRREFSKKLVEVSKNNGVVTDSEENTTTEEPEQPMEGIRRPKKISKAVSLHTIDQRAAQFGMSNSVDGTQPRLHGLGRSMLVPNNNTSVPRPGTTVQGRAIAANIFNSKSPQQESSPKKAEVETRRAPTVSMAPTNVVPTLPVKSATTPNQFNNTPLSQVPSLAGLGRGLGVPRGGNRPGLGMPAVGHQSRTLAYSMADPLL
ncbi:uncharacterized protein [Asterias amurensis]|uniref:uncharacterized protein n=1 Tax=Asterias amurensis TaxID=7602 RepID=UPI003AB1450D